jgi:hypothetical protein
MSFDLTLFPRAGQPPLDRAAFLNSFDDENLHEQNDNTVNYDNRDTGVYFRFTWYAGAAEADKHEGTAREQPYVHFNMNYNRPHTFGLEAVRVLEQVIANFDLVVSDPQRDGMGEGEFTPAGFLRSWNSGNRFAFSALRQLRAQGEMSLQANLSLPMALNAAYWRWNYFRKELCDDLCDLELIGVYVPPVWFCREGDQVKSFALYPNLVPSALPRVDYVMLLRNELSEPFAAHSNETPAWVRWEDLLPVVSRFELRCQEPEAGEEPSIEAHPHLVLFDEDDYDSAQHVPEDLARWVIAQPNWPDKPVRVRPDEILDAELLAGG